MLWVENQLGLVEARVETGQLTPMWPPSVWRARDRLHQPHPGLRPATARGCSHVLSLARLASFLFLFIFYVASISSISDSVIPQPGLTPES